MEIKGLLFKAADKIMAFLNTYRKPRIYVLNSQFNYVPYNVIYITLDIVFRNECTVSRNLYDISVILRNKKIERYIQKNYKTFFITVKLNAQQ